MNRDLPPSPVRRPLTTRIARGIVAAAVTVTIACSGWLPATADQLDDRKDELNKEMAAQAVAVDEAHANLNSAVQAAADARAQLADAKAAHVRLFGTPARALSTDEIRRRIAAGETVGAIAASSQITRQAIYKRLARAGSE